MGSYVNVGTGNLADYVPYAGGGYLDVVTGQLATNLPGTQVAPVQQYTPPPAPSVAPGAPITANMVTSTQLDAWMIQSIGSTAATADQWCFAFNQIAPGACPSLSNAMLLQMGMKGDGSNRTSLPLISSTDFLNAMRNVQLNNASTAQGPGGSQTQVTNSPTPGSAPGAPSSTPNTPPTTAPVQQGVLGLTSCPVCQQLASNPVLLLVVAVALYFLFVH